MTHPLLQAPTHRSRAHTRAAQLASVLAVGLLLACSSAPAPTYEEELRAQLIEAQPGDVIEIPAGVHAISRSLTLNVDGVTIRGAGMSESVLSFKDQIQGAEGLLVNASNFTIEDVGIEDSKGDALKVNEGSDIIIRRVRTEWTNGPDETNGAYGIYPVQTTRVLVEGCVAIAASDAGIYVGQSREIVVRGNRAELNVAGIEIENSIHADVYDNVAVGNTAGILVFNMPQLPQLGHSTRVYDNEIRANNTRNFAPEGTAVSTVPSGSGVVISSNDKVEIFRNQIADNKTANVWISSYMSSGLYGKREEHDVFDPYPETIYIYGNTFTGGGDAPVRDVIEQARITLLGKDGRVPDIVWDGWVDSGKDGDPASRSICVNNGDAQVLNVDRPNEGASPFVGLSGHECSHPKLDPVSLDSAS